MDELTTICFRCGEDVEPCDEFPYWSHAPGTDHKHGVNPVNRSLLTKKKPTAEDAAKRAIVERVNRARRLRNAMPRVEQDRPS